MLIGITGKAGSGKDTAADFLIDNFGGEKQSLAGPIKDAVASMFGQHPEDLTREQKESSIPGFDFTWREAMQTLGTEWGRSLSEFIWLDIIAQKFKTSGSEFFVVPDIRFDNEAEWIQDNDGLLIEIRRKDLRPVAAHASEQGVAVEADIIINNDYGFAYLEIEVVDAIEKALNI
jgi:hypothetical protein